MEFDTLNHQVCIQIEFNIFKLSFIFSLGHLLEL